MALPKPYYNSSIEDIFNIEKDISKLEKRFIDPIDDIRSIAQPSVQNSSTTKSKDVESQIMSLFKGLNVSNGEPLESRVHAFYRMLGFPVATKDGSYFSPGYSDNQWNNSNKTISVIDKFNSNTELKSILADREQMPKTLSSVFKKQDIKSSLYGYILTYHKKFSLIKDEQNPFDPDQQAFSVDVRSKEIESFKSKNPNIGKSIDIISSAFIDSIVGGTHKLKPFIVDPNIENTITPASNRICAPFLPDVVATQIEEKKFLKRPGIELIIRERLKSNSSNSNFANNLSQIIQNKDLTSANNIDYSNVVFALNKDINNIDNSLLSFNDLQVSNVTMLVKTIKAVLARLIEAQDDIEKAIVAINWFPIPSDQGPALGSKAGAKLNTEGIDFSTGLNNKITELKIKQLDAEVRRTEIDNEKLGDFASPFEVTVNTEKIEDVDDELKRLLAKRAQVAEKAFIAMGDIEIITGEISGLGLIDVLAIYTALWAIDIEDLVNFLDDESFERMRKYEPILAAGILSGWSGRQEDKSRITSALRAFEIKLTNILNFADGIIADSTQVRKASGEV